MVTLIDKSNSMIRSANDKPKPLETLEKVLRDKMIEMKGTI